MKKAGGWVRMFSCVCRAMVVLESGASLGVAFYLCFGRPTVTQYPAVQKTGCLQTYGMFAHFSPDWKQLRF